MALLLSLLAAIAQPAPAAPQTATAAEERIDPARLTAARDLIAAFELEQNVQRYAPAMAELTAATEIERVERETGMSVPPAVTEQVHAAARAGIAAFYDVMLPAMERIFVRGYARRFNPEELRRLKVLMTDPLMLRTQEVAPEIMRDFNGIMMDLMKDGESLEPSIGRIAQILREWRSSLSAPAQGAPPAESR